MGGSAGSSLTCGLLLAILYESFVGVNLDPLARHLRVNYSIIRSALRLNHYYISTAYLRMAIRSIISNTQFYNDGTFVKFLDPAIHKSFELNHSKQRHSAAMHTEKKTQTTRRRRSHAFGPLATTTTTTPSGNSAARKPGKTPHHQPSPSRTRGLSDASSSMWQVRARVRALRTLEAFDMKDLLGVLVAWPMVGFDWICVVCPLCCVKKQPSASTLGTSSAQAASALSSSSTAAAACLDPKEKLSHNDVLRLLVSLSNSFNEVLRSVVGTNAGGASAEAPRANLGPTPPAQQQRQNSRPAKDLFPVRGVVFVVVALSSKETNVGVVVRQSVTRSYCWSL